MSSNSITNITGDNASVVISQAFDVNTQNVNDNTAGVLSRIASTAYVSSLSLAGYISLTANNTIQSAITFTGSVAASLISGTLGILSFAPINLNIGRTGGTTTFLGTNPFVTNFPYLVSSSSNYKKLIPLRTSTTSVPAVGNNSTFVYPTASQFPAAPVLGIATPIANGISNCQAVGITSFRPIFNAGTGLNVLIVGT